jgi:recombination protein RecA
MIKRTNGEYANGPTMPSAAALRIEIERALDRRFPAALTPVPRTIRETAETGIPEVDTLLDGGLPVGAISEVAGPKSSGRTGLALSFLAQQTQDDRVCAWVDAGDAFDPESAAASGVILRQLLWFRCRGASTVSEGNGSRISPAWKAKTQAPIWTRLDQALRATDLLLQAGGFATIVLDLGDMTPEHGCRIPLATWFRFRQAADRTRCCLVVLGQAAYAQSSAAVVLECAPCNPHTAGGTVLNGFSFEVRRGRQRFTPAVQGARKPPASTWSATGAWAAEERA